jgi:hypothetical protein
VTGGSPDQPAQRILLTGWFSFRHGEGTAGDVLALDAVRTALDQAGLGYDMAWSPVFGRIAVQLKPAYVWARTLAGIPALLAIVETGMPTVRARRIASCQRWPASPVTVSR